MERSKKISRYQLLCLGFLAILSPIIRLLPRYLTLSAGDSAWLGAVLAVAPAAALLLLAAQFFRKAGQDEGFAQIFETALGKPVGKAVTVLIALWLIAYTAFSLRSAADRYVITAYDLTSPEFFAVALLVLAAVPAFGELRTLGRASQVFFPLMLIMLILVFAFAAGDAELSLNAPLLDADLPGALQAMPAVANIMALAVYFGFMEGQVTQGKGPARLVLLWLALLLAAVTALCVFSVGLFGARLTSELDYGFFAIVRSISVFDLFERLESLVLALWVISDFVFLSSLLFIIKTALLAAFGYSRKVGPQPLFSFKNGRYLLWLALAAVLAAELLIPQNAQTFAKLSQELVPFINLIFTFGLIPVIFLVGRLRKRI